MALKNSLMRIIKTGIKSCFVFVKMRPRLRFGVAKIVHALGLNSIARPIYMRFKIVAYSQGLNNFVPKDVSQLSPHARQIYNGLKAAIERYGKESR